MNYNKADFIASYGISSQLPDSDRPELSFRPLQRGQVQPHQQAVQP